MPGAHLAGDLLVAAAAARLMGAPAEAIAPAVRAFRGVEHVLEHVATVDGVSYFNDSKATNVEAARRSVEAFAQPRRGHLGRPLQGRRLRRARAGAGGARRPRGSDRRGGAGA